MTRIKSLVLSVLFVAFFVMINSQAHSTIQLQPIPEDHMAQVNQNKYGLHGKLEAKAGKTDELVSIMLNAADLLSTAKGCRLYIISKDAQNENIIWITEVWDSKTDHDNSLQLEGIKELISQAMPLIEGKPQEGFELEVIGGTGL